MESVRRQMMSCRARQGGSVFRVGDCRRIGRAFRADASLFPQGCNVNFARPVGRGELSAVTYERGVEDLTDSCGTGSVAAANSAPPKKSTRAEPSTSVKQEK